MKEEEQGGYIREIQYTEIQSTGVGQSLNDTIPENSIVQSHPVCRHSSVFASSLF